MTKKLETLTRLREAASHQLTVCNYHEDIVFFACRAFIDSLINQLVERNAQDPQIPDDGTFTAAERTELEYARLHSVRPLGIAQLQALCKSHIEGAADDAAMAGELLKLFPGQFPPVAESEFEPRDTNCLIETLEKMIEKEKVK